MNDCKYLYADWCHNPELCELDGQELCPFYNMNNDRFYCSWYEKKEG